MYISVIPLTFFSSNEQYAELSAGAKFGMSLWPLLAVWIGANTLAEFEVTGVFTAFSMTCQ